MQFVELDRYFIPIEKDEEIDVSFRWVYGKRYGDWRGWEEILKERRVVLLAEADSGKTEEFKNTATRLSMSGKISFFVAIEELADNAFEACLDFQASELFNNWKSGFDDAYFFLDSVDEARLNRKSFDGALKRLARTLGHALNRSHIFISCRISDWKGAEDLTAIEKFLPIPVEKSQNASHDSETALLDPIFSKNETKVDEDEKGDNSKPEIIFVRLASLDENQQEKLSAAVGISDVKSFQQAVWRNGLENYCDRPGDLIELAEYWKKYNMFGSLSEMTEYAVQLKLSERNRYRPDNSQLNIEKAREGAEIIAAALTLGKSFTLQAPGQDPDPELAVGALDPSKLLLDWSDAEINALLRRGIFSPATYGRIRFHHRSTQEYLAAQWFCRLLKQGCPQSVIMNILFAEVYGVDTIVPSLQPTVAWLANSYGFIRNEVLKRNPLVLIQHGDPGSLSIETRQQLLREYTSLQKNGDIADDSLDHKALWMFSHPDLSNVIREIWDVSNEYYFRRDLLRLIREGRITTCMDLVEKIAQDPEQEQYHRIVAVQALCAFKSRTALKLVAKGVIENAESTSSKIASAFARELFPEYLNVDQLLYLIENTNPPGRNVTQSFGYELEGLWDKCPEEWRSQFAKGLAGLSLQKPFVSKYRRISLKYRFLAKYFEPIARQLIVNLGSDEPENELICILMAIERVENSYSKHDDEQPSIGQLVQSNLKIQRALFWADVDEVKENKLKGNEVNLVWHVSIGGSPLWFLSVKDLGWLKNDLYGCQSINDKRIVLSAILNVLNSENIIYQEVEELRKYLVSYPLLSKDLEDYIKPYRPTEAEQERQKKCDKRKAAEHTEIEKNKESWRNLKDELIENPTLLFSKDKKFWCLHNLTHWLYKRTKQDYDVAIRQWNLLEEAFGTTVAENYRDVLKSVWRDIKPQRPQHKSGGPIVTKWVTIFANAGLGIEADENPDWAQNLSKKEAEQAAKHGCMSERGYPDWLDSLFDAHPTVVLPIIVEEFRLEWKSGMDGKSDFLYYFSQQTDQINIDLKLRLFEVILRNQSSSLNKLERGLMILDHMNLSTKQNQRLQRWAYKKFNNYSKSIDNEEAYRYLSVLFKINPENAFSVLKQWIEQVDHKIKKEHALKTLTILFNRSERGLATSSLNSATSETLKNMVLMAYRYIKPSEDNVREGSYTPDFRDKAEDSRNTILSALINATGPEAYHAMLELSDTPEIGERSHRFRQLARSIVDRDAERHPWEEHEIVKFKKEYLTPISTENEFYKVIQNVLDDIRSNINTGDASSKRLLSLLRDIDRDDEESIQNWLAEQLFLRANGRYQIHRESEVADKNKPDIIASAVGGMFEVAIEVKQADSWSPNELKSAFTKQLAEDYLKTQTRRHGILFLTNNGRRNWINPNTHRKLSFQELLNILSEISNLTKTNSTGEIQISVFGLDVT